MDRKVYPASTSDLATFPRCSENTELSSDFGLNSTPQSNVNDSTFDPHTDFRPETTLASPPERPSLSASPPLDNVQPLRRSARARRFPDRFDNWIS